MQDKLQRWIDQLVPVYCVGTILYQAIFLVLPIRAVMIQWNLDIISSLLAVAGFGLFCLDLIMERVFLKGKYVLYLIATLGVLCLSTLAWLDYGWVDNAKVIIWQIAQMLVIFPAYRRISKEQWQKILRIGYWILSAVYIPTVLISLLQFFSMKGGGIHIQGYNIRTGFRRGRLWGFFNGTYFPSVMCAIAAMASIYFGIKAKSRAQKISYFLFAGLYFTQMILSGTRSVLVGVMAAVALLVFFGVKVWWENKQKESNAVKKYSVCVLLAVCAAFSCFGIAEGVDEGLKRIAQETSKVLELPDFLYGNISPTETTQTKRDDVTTDNVSNNRLVIWGEYLDIGTDSLKAIVLGHSPGEYMTIIRDQYPNYYIVKQIREHYLQMYADGLIYDAHNCYLLIFISAGLLGVLTLGAFLLLCVKRVLCHLMRQKKLRAETMATLVMLVIILIAAFFDSDLFFKCTSNSVTFWLLAGLMMKETEEETAVCNT